MRILLIILVLTGLCAAEVPLLRVGHVGHDHHLALFVAADAGPALAVESGGVWLRPLKDQQVYELIQADQVIAQLHLSRVKGGSAMPAALERGAIDCGLGGLAPTVLAIDRGAPLTILAPANTDGDMLLLSPGLACADWAAFVALVRAREQPLRIGYKAPLAVAYLIFAEALRQEGLRCGPQAMAADGTPVAVQLINCKGGKNLIPSLASGSIDGMVMNQPVIAVAEERGLGTVVCDLRALPPAGHWQNHPCCCLAARVDAVATQAAPLTALVQALIAAGRRLAAEPLAQVAVAARWCGQSAAVELRSLPTVGYVPTWEADWQQGIVTWFALLGSRGHLTGRLAACSPQEAAATIHDPRIITAAQAALAP